MTSFARRRARDILLGAPPAKGWAGSSLDRSLERTLVLGAVLWQAVMIWSVLGSDLRLPAPLLIGSSLVVAACGLLVLRGHLHPGVLAVVTYAGVLVAWFGADSVTGALCFAGAWQHNLLAAAVPLASRHRTTVIGPTLMAAITPVFLLTVHDDWQALASSSIVTTLSIVIGAKLAVPFLRRFADAADDASLTSAVEQERLVVAQTATTEAAEDARTLHDTVINTFAAIAAGGAAVDDPQLVRDRCRRDVPVIEGLLEGRASREDLGIRAVGASQAVTLDWTGASAAETSMLEAELTTAVRRSLTGSVREALLNVAKHSGTHRATIDVRVEASDLVVTVSDDGAGFDGVTPAGRGLAESVLRRSADAGIKASIRTDPGRGTQITLRAPAAASTETRPVLVPGHDFATVLSSLRDRGSWAWAATVIGVGFTIAPLNTPPEPAFAMLGLLIALTVTAWLTTRHRAHLPVVVSAVIVAAIPVVFVLSFASVDYGRVDIIRWQAIAVTALPVILLVHARTRAERLAGVLAHLVTVAVLAGERLDTEPEIAAVVAVAGVPALAIVAAWTVFLRTIDDIAARAVDEQRSADDSRLESSLVAAVADARVRWTTAGLQASLRLLRDLADGSADAADPAVRAACATEEAHLRQLTLLSPRAVHMGPWFAQALADARTQGVELVVRTGDLDVDDRDEAEALGSLVVEAVGQATPGERVTVGLFVDGSAPQLTVLGPDRWLAELADSTTLPERWTAEVSPFGDTDLVIVRRHESRSNA
ncbi:hypothetical protein GCM10009710_30320 [Aeromicrobium alkaliterrae]|uniref:Histidine kinase/HSP90-like ATPase domain-containing protein n=1 Tax=Aeromicrobium alkaliterrae TaxID=302168 RepID=A0ABN2K4H5_9ACTN